MAGSKIHDFFSRKKSPSCLPGRGAWSKLVSNGELPEEDLANPHARSKEFAEEPSLRRPRPGTTRRPVLDVPGACLLKRIVPVGSTEEYEYTQPKNSFEL